MKVTKKNHKLKEIKEDKNKPKVKKEITYRVRKIMNVEMEEYTPIEEQLEETLDH